MAAKRRDLRSLTYSDVMRLNKGSGQVILLIRYLKAALLDANDALQCEAHTEWSPALLSSLDFAAFIHLEDLPKDSLYVNQINQRSSHCLR